MQTFYLDADILFGCRHFIWMQTFYLDADILFGYKDFIWIQTFHLIHSIPIPELVKCQNASQHDSVNCQQGHKCGGGGSPTG